MACSSSLTKPESLDQSRYHTRRCFSSYLSNGRRIMKLHQLMDELEKEIPDPKDLLSVSRLKTAEIIVDGVTGFHIDPNNRDESSNRIADVFENCKMDTEYWRTISLTGLKRINEWLLLLQRQKVAALATKCYSLHWVSRKLG
ncbi:hypothetical protein MLD38_022855 [Melastoma candidum]|uniref:Uncharacterized protein n=1 Tax=Melastoma candidum TaxID=119954 RepID=A0ACB9QKM6_9MYRT|nr:hypothetical protein MLD38_022855 [Melastoma candidum]